MLDSIVDTNKVVSPKAKEALKGALQYASQEALKEGIWFDAFMPEGKKAQFINEL